MAEYMNDKWTAGKGTTALGIIGTALGGLATVGGNLGIACNNNGMNELQMELIELREEVQFLKQT